MKLRLQYIPGTFVLSIGIHFRLGEAMLGVGPLVLYLQCCPR